MITTQKPALYLTARRHNRLRAPAMFVNDIFTQIFKEKNT